MVTALRIGGGFINHPRWVSTLHTKTNIVKVWKGHKYAICLECSLSVFLKLWKPDTTRLLPRSAVSMRVLYRQKDALRTYLPSCQMHTLVLASLRRFCMKTANRQAYGYAGVLLWICNWSCSPKTAAHACLRCLGREYVQPAYYVRFRRYPNVRKPHQQELSVGRQTWSQSGVPWKGVTPRQHLSFFCIISLRLFGLV